MKGCSPTNHKLNLKKQLACIYTNNFFSGLRITDAVWVALLAGAGLAVLGFLVALTGAAALGRKTRAS